MRFDFACALQLLGRAGQRGGCSPGCRPAGPLRPVHNRSRYPEGLAEGLEGDSGGEAESGAHTRSGGHHLGGASALSGNRGAAAPRIKPGGDGGPLPRAGGNSHCAPSLSSLPTCHWTDTGLRRCGGLQLETSVRHSQCQGQDGSTEAASAHGGQVGLPLCGHGGAGVTDIQASDAEEAVAAIREGRTRILGKRTNPKFFIGNTVQSICLIVKRGVRRRKRV